MLLVGIAIGGLMHGYIPEGFFEKYMDKDNLFAVPIATILAVPMYSNASGILPSSSSIGCKRNST